MQTRHRIDLVGAITANVYILLIISLFAARIAGRFDLAHWIGLAALFNVVPLTYLLVAGQFTNRAPIYFVWLGLMIGFQFVELLVDYILRLEFRNVQWVVVPYVMLFFGATGGMVGLAAQAGKRWVRITGCLFLLMAAMAFIQRGVTGL